MGTYRIIGIVVTSSLGVLFACTGGPGIDTSSSSSSSSSSSGLQGSSSGGSSGSSSSSSSSSSSTSSGSSGGKTGASCRAAKDCTTPGDLCIGGNVPAGCGGAYIHDCDVDGECQVDGGAKVCSKGDCSGMNRCIDPECAGPTDTSCGVNDVCNDRQCVAKSCATDGECSGYCVNGVCSSSLGTCNAQAEYP